MSDRTGEEIKGYEIRDLIGEGGFGAVYRAFQSVVGRDVAIKAILPEHANQPEFVRRFESEAQMVARLESLHIVPLFDYWRDPTGAYLVMRWLRGGSLEAMIRKEGPRSVEDATRLLEQVASALAVAHRNRIIHRDLKPANILLDEEGNAYLTDFGIAKSLGSKVDSEGDDEVEGLTGSPAYMSPEQILQKPVTPQTDIYSLGCVMYEVLTGKLPFTSKNVMGLLYQHLNDPLPPLFQAKPDLPDQLDLVIQRATAKNPADRYLSVIDMYTEFRQAANRAHQMGERFGFGDGQMLEIIGLEPEALEAVNPYKGLRAFQEGDAADFFGRSALTTQLVGRMAEQTPLARFLAVVGPSGSGKSSVVKAGLLPALRSDALPGSASWFYVEMTPRADPMMQLNDALLKVSTSTVPNLSERLAATDDGFLRALLDLLPGQTELVLVIDQFEEVFTQLDNESERRRFLNGLRIAATAPSSRLRLVITLRADFYDRPLLYQEFGDLMRQRTEVVLPLSNAELTEAIVNPAERVGVHMNEDLVAAILNDVGEQPGTLPLLQYALTELFERRQGRALTLEAYQASGGVLGSLARRADELYLSLNPTEQEATRQLFLRLVTLGEGVEDTRRRVRRTELAATVGDDAMLDSIIDRFSRYRLLTSDRDPVTRGPTVEVAHEALIRTWMRLREWLAGSRESIRLERQLMTSAVEWQTAGRDPSFLAAGARLSQFETLIGADLALNQEERVYLDMSIAERETQQMAEEARRRHELELAQEAAKQAEAAAKAAEKTVVVQRRSAQRLRVFLAVLAVAFVGAVGAAVVAVQARQAAVSAATLSDALRFASDSSGLLPSVSNNPELAALLALRSLKQTYSPQAEAALNRSLQLLYTENVLSGHTDGIYSMALSPDGKTLVTGSKDNTAKIWDTATGQLKFTLSGHKDWVRAVAFSPDSKYALTGSYDKTAVLWDVTTGRQLQTFPQGSQVWAVAFAPDGKSVATGSTDKTAVVWDVASGKPLQKFTHTSTVASVLFSPDGKSLITGGYDRLVHTWDMASGKELSQFKHLGSIILIMALSPDGKTLLTGADDGLARLWTLSTGTLVTTLQGHSGSVFGAAFSPDGKHMLTSGYDATVRLWNVATGQEERRLLAHTGYVYSVAFSPDGLTAYSAGFDRTVRVWDIGNGTELRRLSAGVGSANSATFSHDNRYILTASDDGTVRLWDAATHQQIRVFRGHTKIVEFASFSPDDRYVVTASDDKTARIWDTATGRELRTLAGHQSPVYTAVFSPDEKYILTASPDKTIRLWDVATGEEVRRFTDTNQVYSAVFSPDGQTILSGNADKVGRLWSVATGQILHTLSGHTSFIYRVTFSPDGKYALTASYDFTAKLWDVATGAEVRTFTGHQGTVFGIDFSSDGKYLLTGSADNTARLWDVATGTELRRFIGHTSQLNTAVISPDGKYFLTASNDGTARLWDADYRSAMTFTCTRLFRDLSADELKTYYTAEGKTPDSDPTCPQFGAQAAPLPPTATPLPIPALPSFPPLPIAQPTQVILAPVP